MAKLHQNTLRIAPFNRIVLEYTPKVTKFTIENKIFLGEHALEPPSKRVLIEW